MTFVSIDLSISKRVPFMRRPIAFFLALIIFLSTVTPSLAWNATGHMLVALVAYENLSPAKQRAVVSLIKKHERFNKDFRDRMPATVKKMPQAAQDKWIFMQAATWPDIARGIRLPKNRTRKVVYHHAVWHYINQPLFLSEEDRTAMEGHITVPLDQNWKVGQEPQNIAQAYKKNIHELKTSSSLPDKAIAMCWVIHLVGDIHQPLHSSALFSQDQFPKGDHGGNSILLSGKPLHSYWDSLLGNGTAMTTLQKLNTGLKNSMNVGDVGKEAVKSMDFGKWIDESADLAADHAYTTKIRKAVQDVEVPEEDGKIDVGAQSQEYRDDATSIAEKRIVEAGFRLAKVIEGLPL